MVPACHGQRLMPYATSASAIHPPAAAPISCCLAASFSRVCPRHKCPSRAATPSPAHHPARRPIPPLRSYSRRPYLAVAVAPVRRRPGWQLEKSAAARTVGACDAVLSGVAAAPLSALLSHLGSRGPASMLPWRLLASPRSPPHDSFSPPRRILGSKQLAAAAVERCCAASRAPLLQR